MKITFFQRKPYDFHFSIEKLFSTIKSNFSNNLKLQTYILPYISTGVIPRLKSGFAARAKQGQINHITGDIHFITPFLSKRKTINTYHDFTFLKDSRGLKHFLLWLFWVYIPIKRSTYITVISEVTKKELIQLVKFPKDKILVIPNIISTDFHYVRKDFNQEKPIILHIGTTPNKNLQRLIYALNNLSCQLILIGKLSQEDKSLLKKNRIDYINKYQISDKALKQEYIKCDMLSFCSLNEGFGMPILEAQAIGRPVITSNISSMPEVAGNAACLIDPYDISSIKSGIEKIINNSVYREDLIVKGLENVKRFNPKTVAGMYESLYKKMYQELYNR